MIIEGHLFNDKKRFGESYERIHKTLDQYHRTDKFCSIPIHTLEYLLELYNKKQINIKELRAGIFHLLDDFGNEIPLLEDWNNDEHWLGQYCKQKLEEQNNVRKKEEEN